MWSSKRFPSSTCPAEVSTLTTRSVADTNNGLEERVQTGLKILFQLSLFALIGTTVLSSCSPPEEEGGSSIKPSGRQTGGEEGELPSGTYEATGAAFYNDLIRRGARPSERQKYLCAP